MAIKSVSVTVPIGNRWHSQIRIIPGGFIYKGTICKVEPQRVTAVTWFNNDRVVVTLGLKERMGEIVSRKQIWVEKTSLEKRHGSPEASWQEEDQGHVCPHLPLPSGPSKLLPGPPLSEPSWKPEDKGAPWCGPQAQPPGAAGKVEKGGGGVWHLEEQVGYSAFGTNSKVWN